MALRSSCGQRQETRLIGCDKLPTRSPDLGIPHSLSVLAFRYSHYRTVSYTLPTCHPRVCIFLDSHLSLVHLPHCLLERETHLHRLNLISATPLSAPPTPSSPQFTYVTLILFVTSACHLTLSFRSLLRNPPPSIV